MRALGPVFLFQKKNLGMKSYGPKNNVECYTQMFLVLYTNVLKMLVI